MPKPPTTPGLTGYREHVYKRCPGAAAQTGPDRSNPYVAGGTGCSTEDNPK